MNAIPFSYVFMISPKNKQKENRVHRYISLPVTVNPT